ncbi:MAG TPA: hypothetical protein DFR83_06370 [Deltaproteobacteria bacterium]|nr:hypothetical protein [Deltaproteobacteria bacterium]
MRRCSLLLPRLLALSAIGCGGIGGEAIKDDTGAGSDLDGDGYSGADDCDDTNAAVHVDAPEVCDGIDNDCDARVDSNDDSLTDGFTLYPDADGDTFGDDSAAILSCEAAAGYVETPGDCDDADSAINPSANESCSTATDDNCNGNLNDDGAEGCLVFYADADGDGYADEGTATTACLCFDDDAFPTQEVGDCAEGDATIHPGADEICNDGIDQDCDGDWDECRIATQEPVDGVAVAIQGLTDDAYAGAVMSAGPDLDGDGSADLSISIASENKAYLYTSVPTEATTLLTADVVFEAESSSTLEMVHLVQDVSGDGVADVIGYGTSSFIGDPEIAIWQSPSGTVDQFDAETLLSDNTQSIGVTHLFALRSSGTTADIFTHDAAAQELRFYSALDTGAYQHTDYLYGSIAAPGATSSAALDDIDGDGFQELAVTSPESGSGMVDVLLSDDIAIASSIGSASWTIAGEDSGDQMGASIASAGDLNGDGYGDVVVGAPYHDDTTSNTGSAYVFFGQANPSGPVTGGDADAEVAGELRNDYAGTSVTGLGDLDGDGNLDLGVGAPGFDYGGMDFPGAAYALYGPISGYQSLNDVLSRLGGSNTNGTLGSTMAGAADLDGDGYDDYILGEPGFDTTADTAAGAIWVFFGKGL